jgi:hypothetical protein
MSAMEPLCRLIGVTSSMLNKEETILIEAELFIRICEELKKLFRERYRNYFRLMRFTLEKENIMLEAKFAQLIIKDILSTDDYDLRGIAHYTHSHEEVVEEVVTGRNTNPSAAFLRRLIDLHRLVRCDLYHVIIKKIATQFLAVA